MIKWPEHAKRYGVEESYIVGMKWLNPCKVVEDWGCGPAYSKTYRKGAYIGIDGTEGFCDIVADLATRTSDVDGIFMRHVLEHNVDWRPILDNALRSFSKRMSLIMFTPWAEETKIVHYWEHVPFISFKRSDILEEIGGYLKDEIVIKTKKPGLYDTVFLLEKE